MPLLAVMPTEAFVEQEYMKGSLAHQFTSSVSTIQVSSTIFGFSQMVSTTGHRPMAFHSLCTLLPLFSIFAAQALSQSTPLEPTSTSFQVYNTDVLDPPVPAEPANAPPIPIIALSEQYILGQINGSIVVPHNISTPTNTTVHRREQPAVSEWMRSPLLKRQVVEGPIQCGPGNPCKDGSCCNTSGKCGFKEATCGETCISNCEAKAMCGIDSEGGNVSCALNLCCSYYGWCGVSHPNLFLQCI